MKINRVVPKKVLMALSKYLHHYYKLVETERIYELILQVNFVDVAIHLLQHHSKTDLTLDNIIMMYLQGRDNAENKQEFDNKFNKDKYVNWYKEKRKKK
jgi:hypothetical protein